MNSVFMRMLKILSIVIFSGSAVITTGDNSKDLLNRLEDKKFIGISDISKFEIVKEEKQEEIKSEEKVQVNYLVNDKKEEKVQSANTSNTLVNSISIPGVLNKPLMKDNDGSNFYLNHNINGVYDGKGVPYIDFRTNFNTRKTIIYAHSAPTGDGPFQALQNYHNNRGYYAAHPDITITFDNKTYRYRIFSVYVSVAENAESEGLEYFYNMDYTDDGWQNTLNKYKSNSEYDTGVVVNSNDKILILQTCSMDPNYNGKYYRANLLIMGKLV